MLYVRSPELIHLINEKFVPFDQYLPCFTQSLAPDNHHSFNSSYSSLVSQSIPQHFLFRVKNLMISAGLFHKDKN